MNRYKHTSYFVKQIVSVLCGDYWGYGEPEGWNGIEFIFVEKIKDYKYSCVCDVKNCVSESSGRERIKSFRREVKRGETYCV